MATLSDLQLVKRDVDRIIDYRRFNRPHDYTDIRVNVERKIMHKGLHPEVPLDPHIENKDLPVTCLYRGYRIVSIPREANHQKEQNQKPRKTERT